MAQQQQGSGDNRRTTAPPPRPGQQPRGSSQPRAEVLPPDDGNGLALAPSVIGDITRAEVDMQVATAKKYPRSISKFREDARSMALLDRDVAESCFYSLPRKERDPVTGEQKVKLIQGPSIRLGEICASAWGNMKIAGRIIEIGETHVTAQGVAWDMERNVLIAREVRRRITSSKGYRYNEDMINTTANAAISIAIRNAITEVIPSAYIKPLYEECRTMVRDKNREGLGPRRLKVLDQFEKTYKIPRERIFRSLEIKGVEDISIELLEELIARGTALRDDPDLTPDGVFPLPGDDQPTTSAPPAAGEPQEETPVTICMRETGATAKEAGRIIEIFEALAVNPGARLIRMKRYQASGAKLLDELEAELRADIAAGDQASAQQEQQQTQPLDSRAHAADGDSAAREAGAKQPEPPAQGNGGTKARQSRFKI
jgi:hypothetical protein